MIRRWVSIATAALFSGATVTQHLVDREIERRVKDEIETAKEHAVKRLDQRLSAIVSEQTTSFAINLAIKAGMLGAVFLFYANGLLAATGFKIAAGLVICIFLLRDVAMIAPYLGPSLKLAREHRWRLREAAGSIIANAVFERAFLEAMQTIDESPAKRWLAVSSYNAHGISAQIAAAVADIARESGYQRLRTRALIGAAFAVASLSVYAGFVVLIAIAA